MIESKDEVYDIQPDQCDYKYVKTIPEDVVAQYIKNKYEDLKPVVVAKPIVSSPYTKIKRGRR